MNKQEIGTNQKLCTDCQTVKNKTSFHQSSIHADGYNKRCKSCQNIITRHKAEVYAERSKARAKLKQANKVIEPQQARQPIKVKPQNDLDRLFSLIIRTCHPKFCHSCGTPHEISDAQCGHIVNRTKFAVRYDLRNALPICVTCNYFVEKHTDSLIKRVIELYGEDAYDQVNIKKFDEFRPSQGQRDWLEKMFQTLLKSLTDDTDRNTKKLIEAQRTIDLIFDKVV